MLQIALGVFLGTLASQLTIDSWRNYRDGMAKDAERKLKAEQEKVRFEQGERIRALLLQGRQGQSADAVKPPPGFVPDDARMP